VFIHNLRSRLPHLFLLIKLAAQDAAGDEVPTELINRPTGGDASGPCSLCRVKTIKDAEGTSNGSATLELYYDDEQSSLHANITVTYQLANGEYGHQVVEGVDLVAGGTSWYPLRPGDGWSWANDVEYLWVEVTDADS
jgi:hypothetical protein